MPKTKKAPIKPKDPPKVPYQVKDKSGNTWIVASADMRVACINCDISHGMAVSTLVQKHATKEKCDFNKKTNKKYNLVTDLSELLKEGFKYRNLEENWYEVLPDEEDDEEEDDEDDQGGKLSPVANKNDSDTDSDLPAPASASAPPKDVTCYEERKEELKKVQVKDELLEILYPGTWKTKQVQAMKKKN